ncbi:MAG: CmcJ/NvfI family oxidoreductase [Gammaproteobacteria bacterium]|nr:CmcJ/NvfI family oxidoreductase [Gammaproteobacteria bacterium]
MAFETDLGFVHPRQRGFRVPNQYSALTPDELKDSHTRERVVIRNARFLDPQPTLSTHGFQLVNAPSSLDLLDNEVVKKQFYPEVRNLIKSVTNCYEVRGGGHEYRNGYGGQSGTLGARPTPNGSAGVYAGGIHSDMCAAVEKAFNRIVPDNRHFESLNVWRSVKKNEFVEMMPLAVCDMRSVEPEDITFGDGQNTGDVRQFYKVISQGIIHSPKQRWYYFPNMTEDEVLIFRQYDTRKEPLNLRTVFHTAVSDPATRVDAPMRYTIEVRMQAVHDVENNKVQRMKRFIDQISDQYASGRKSNWWSGPIENYVPPPEYRTA